MLPQIKILDLLERSKKVKKEDIIKWLDSRFDIKLPKTASWSDIRRVVRRKVPYRSIRAYARRKNVKMILRTLANLSKLLFDLKNIDKYLVSKPASENELYNIVSAYLNALGYDIVFRGKKDIDFIIGDVGLEIKLVKRKRDLDIAHGQCVRYKRKYETVILLAFILEEIKSLNTYIKNLRKDGIEPVFILY